MSVRRFIDIASILGIVASPIALGVVYSQTTARPVVAQTIEVTTKKNFPLDQPQVVSFDLNANFKKLTPRQQDDQLRDWLLFTALSGKGLSSQQLSQGAYDLPAVRYNFMNPVAKFEYGTIRSRSIDKDRIVALVPKASTPEQRKDDIAHIVDRHRKDQGEKPKVIEVFEYDINTNKVSGSITRRQDIDASKLFTPEYAYFETTINSTSDLQKFLSQTDDITFSEMTGASLTLGGRKLFSQKYQGIRLEDVAALWQSEKNIETRWQNFQQEQEAKIKGLSYSEQEKAIKDAVIKEKEQGLVNGSGFSLDPKFDYSGLKESLEKALPLIKSLKLDGKQVISDQEIQDAKQGLQNNSVVAYRQLIDKFKNFSKSEQGKNALKEGQFGLELKKQAQPLLAQRDKDIKAQITIYENQARSEIQAQALSLQKAGYSREQIQAQLEPEIQKQQQKLKQIQQNIINDVDKEYKAKFLQIADAKYAKIDELLKSQETKGFQAARYDGDLQGTEVGMVLFYTDLLAKIWALNYVGSTPYKDIPDFVPLTKVKVSPIYKEETEKLNQTRLWFGHQDKGFQVTKEGNSLLFARNATRIYAASSNPLDASGKETTAAPDSSAFLNWWNDHYEEVARYEPQYQRLNQIMKWSLVVSWLNESYQGNKLGFLQDVTVKRDNVFPQWVQAKNDLRFQAWNKIQFYPVNYKGVKTETMPLLKSDKFERFGEKNRYFVGGVSLASKSTFKERTALPLASEFNLPARRSDINYKSIFVENGKLKFDTFEGNKYQIQQVSNTISETTVIPKPDARLRSLNAELSNQTFTSKFVQSPGRTEYSTAVGGVNLGNLNVSRTANGFRTGFESRDVDIAYALASDLSVSKGNSVEVLANASGVKSYKYSPSKPDNYYVELPNGNWLELSSSGGGGAKPPSNSIINVGEPEGGRSFFVKELTKSSVPDETQGFKQFAGKATGFDDSEPINYGSEAKKLVENPALFFASKQKSLKQSISTIDKALKNGDYPQAAKLISESEFASHPTIKMRQALIDIHENRLKVELVTPEGVKSVDNNFFDEINNREFQVRETDKEIFYVQDSASLNNLDFKVTVAQTVSSNSGVKFYKLEAGGTGGGNGGRNGNYGNIGDSGNPSNEFRGSNINFALRTQFQNNPAAFTNDEKCQTEDDKKEECETEKPAYIVTK